MNTETSGDAKQSPQRKPIAVASGRFSEDELREVRAGFALRMRAAFDGASNAEIARRLNSNDTTIKTYMDGDRMPIAEMLLAIARTTGANLHWLLTGQGEQRIARGDLFSEEEETAIRELARAASRSFDDEVRVLARAAVAFLRDAG